VNEERQERYLWDPAAPPDAQVEDLERLLGRYRYRGPVRRPRTLRLRAWMALAAGIAAVALAWWALRADEAPAYRVVGLDGVTRVRSGEEVATGTGQSARIEIAALGHVDVEPGSSLRVEDRGREVHSLYLARGSVRAVILAQPRVFQIGSPAGRTIDLGCEYSLEVAPDGGSILRVVAGQVAFEFEGREVYVPAGATCVSDPLRGPGAPVREEAPAGYCDLVAAVEFHPEPDLRMIKDVIDVDREDLLTVWHLLTSRRAAPELRRAAYAQLERAFPKPAWVTLEGLLAGDRAMHDAWLEEMKPA